MCHFDNFDIDQIASKLAQRWNFVHSFYCKKISVLDSFDNAKNAKRHLFFGHPIQTMTIFGGKIRSYTIYVTGVDIIIAKIVHQSIMQDFDNIVIKNSL